MVGTSKKKIDPGILEAIKEQMASLKSSVLTEILAALAKLQVGGLTTNPARDIIEESNPIFIPSDISKDYNTEITVQEDDSKESGAVDNAIESLRKAKKVRKDNG